MEKLICKWIEGKEICLPKSNTEMFICNNNQDMKSRLSKKAYKMLCVTGIRESSIRNRKVIEDLFKANNIPLFESVIKFQELYGGLSYTISGCNTGYIADLFYLREKDETKFMCGFEGIAYMDNKYYFNCMNYDSHDERGPFIDEEGKIYEKCREVLIPLADNTNEFFYNEGICYEKRKLNREDMIKIINSELDIIKYVKTYKSEMPNMKNSFDLDNLVARFPKQKVRNLIYSGEMTAEQIADKLLADIENLEYPL